MLRSCSVIASSSKSSTSRARGSEAGVPAGCGCFCSDLIYKTEVQCLENDETWNCEGECVFKDDEIGIPDEKIIKLLQDAGYEVTAIIR